MLKRLFIALELPAGCREALAIPSVRSIMSKSATHW
jgi:hypothetical protein